MVIYYPKNEVSVTPGNLLREYNGLEDLLEQISSSKARCRMLIIGRIAINIEKVDRLLNACHPVNDYLLPISWPNDEMFNEFADISRTERNLLYNRLAAFHLKHDDIILSHLGFACQPNYGLTYVYRHPDTSLPFQNFKQYILSYCQHFVSFGADKNLKELVENVFAAHAPESKRKNEENRSRYGKGSQNKPEENRSRYGKGSQNKPSHNHKSEIFLNNEHCIKNF